MYLDTSAAVKLLVREKESTALVKHLSAGVRLVSSELLLTEAHRVCLRLGLDGRDAAERLIGVDILGIQSAHLSVAGVLTAPPGRSLRTLDAIHLAAALALEEDEILTYDDQQAAAAEHYGLAVVSPGRPRRWWSEA